MSTEPADLSSAGQKRPTWKQALVLLAAGLVLIPGLCFIVVIEATDLCWLIKAIVWFSLASLICTFWGLSLLIVHIVRRKS